jgi:hypothetical protein
MTISHRSRFLLLGSGLAPLAAAIVRFQYWRLQREAGAGGGFVLDFHPAYIFTAMALVGITCFVGVLISLLLDYVHTKKTK